MLKGFFNRRPSVDTCPNGKTHAPAPAVASPPGELQTAVFALG